MKKDPEYPEYAEMRHGEVILSLHSNVLANATRHVIG